MKSKLNIIEPWEHGTEKSIDVDIIGKNNNYETFYKRVCFTIGIAHYNNNIIFTTRHYLPIANRHGVYELC